MRTPLLWTQHCKDEKEKEALLFILQNNRVLIDRLLLILEKFEAEEDVLTTQDYDSPSWAYKQADRNGAVRSLRKVKKLFDFN